MGSLATVSNVPPRRHPVFWFEDGSLLLQVQDHLYRLHGELLYRQSNLLKESQSLAVERSDHYGPDPPHHIYVVDPTKNMRPEDVSILLEHLYHDEPLSSSSSLPRLAAIIRTTSINQLDMPRLHRFAISLLERLYPNEPVPFAPTEHLLEAFLLATEFRVEPVRKRLLYGLVATEHFESHASGVPQPGLVLDANISSELSSAQAKIVAHRLTSDHVQQCSDVMERLINHFTPILFTPAATPHMACTDVFADTWMSLVIQPALEDSGVCKPLETLERMKNMDWAEHGLCSACVREKREEWSEEQAQVWKLLDDWMSTTSS
ncbi:hypothetical protein HGRIS_012590 [Hohenbuehelia grisea]|uniref:BTB domain-containing protein n=1 Tax=Hohenbuehelia grisea TaxID=104357 RepID=A0ABR3ISS8_9AGAR